MIVQVNIGQVVTAILKHYQYLVITIKLTKILTLPIIIESLDVSIEPNLATTQSAATMTLQRHLAHFNLRQDIASTASTLDGNLAEVLVEEDFLQLWIRLEGNLHHFSLAIWIGSEIKHPRALIALCQVILSFANHRRHIEALNVADACLAITIDCIVDSALIILAEDGNMDDFSLLLLLVAAFRLTNEELLCNVNYLIGTVAVEDDNIVNIRAVRDKLILLQRGTDEAILSVDVELLVGFHNLSCSNGVEVAYLCQTWMVLAILLLDEAEPVASNLHHVFQLMVYLLYLFLDGSNVLLGLVLVELQDAGHLDVHQLQDVVLSHLTHHLRIVWCQSLINPFASSIHRLCLLELFVLIDSFFYENLLKSGKVQALHQLTTTDEPFLSQQCQRVVNTCTQHITYGKELRLSVLNDTTVW